MKTRKVFEKIAYSLIGILAVALICVVVYQRQQIGGISQNNDTEISGKVGPADSTLAATEAVLPSGDSGGNTEKEVEDLMYQLNAVEEELDMAQAELSEELERKAELRRQQAELQKKMMQDPSFKNQIISNLDTRYSELFEELDLAPETLDTLKALMAESQIAMMDVYSEVFTASTSEEKDALQQRFDDILKEKSASVEDLLGYSDYEAFATYEDRMISKNYVERFNESLSDDEKLTEDQEQELVTIMCDAQNSTFSELGYDPRRIIDFPSDITDETIAERFVNEEQIHLQSVEYASSILSDSQLKQFEENLARWREMEEMSMEMAMSDFEE